MYGIYYLEENDETHSYMHEWVGIITLGFVLLR